MITNGTITEILTDGYERTICLESADGQYWFDYLDTNEYTHENQKIRNLKTGMSIEISLSLIWVTNLECQEQENSRLELIQNKPKSSHAIVKGVVIKVVDPFTILVEVDKSRIIKIEFEKKIEAKIGSWVILTGNLNAESVKVL